MFTGSIFTLLGSILWEIGGICAAAEAQLDLCGHREYEPCPVTVSGRPRDDLRPRP